MTDYAMSGLPERYAYLRANPADRTHPFTPTELENLRGILDRLKGGWPGQLNATTEQIPMVTKAELTPGAKVSTERGCRCSSLLNADGAGVREFVGQAPVSVAWFVAIDCPMHERIYDGTPISEEDVVSDKHAEDPKFLAPHDQDDEQNQSTEQQSTEQQQKSTEQQETSPEAGRTQRSKPSSE